MVIKLLKSDTFERPVLIIAPDGTKTPLTAKFLYMPQKEADAFVDEKGEEELLKKVLEGWKDFKDVDGKAVKDTAANRKDVIETPFVRARFLLAYAQAIVGLQLGNLGPSPEPGRRHQRTRTKKSATKK